MCALRPGPVANRRVVLEICACVCDCVLDTLVQLGNERRNPTLRKRRMTERERSEMKAAHLVEYHHVERGRSRSLLDEPPNVEAPGVGSPVHYLMDGVPIAMECEDDRLALGEQLHEPVGAHAVRMNVGWE